MSTLSSFNSSLLDSLKKEWQGLFYDKFFQALDVLNTQKDLDLAAKKIFPEAEIEIAEPSEEKFRLFGQGNSAQDAEILQYLDNAMFQNISDRQFIACPHNIPAELMQHETLKKYHIASCVFFNTPSQEPVKIENLNDLCFLGCCGILQASQMQKDNTVEVFNLNYDTNPAIQDQTNYLQINTEVFSDSIREIIKLGKDPKILNSFLDFNKGNIALNTYFPRLQHILPEVLSSSSFLWQRNTFNVSPQMVEAMSEKQKIMTLVENKSAVIERCFRFLMEDSDVQEQRDFQIYLETQGYLKKAFAESERLTDLLRQKADLQDIYSIYYTKSRRLKNGLLELAETLGVEEKEAANKLLELFSLRDVELESFKTNDVDEVFVNLLLAYKQETIKASAEKAKIGDIDQEIAQVRKDLEKSCVFFLMGVRGVSTNNQTKKLNLLKVNAVFSFVLLNEDLFPEVPVKGAIQKKGAEKVSSILGKMKLRTAFQKFKNTQEPIEELKQSDAFAYILNGQIKSILKAYRQPSSTYQYTNLSPEDFDKIVTAANTVNQLALEGNQKAVEKYLNLENVLQKLFVSQSSFRVAVSKNPYGVNRKVVQSVQSHFYACLIFANAPQDSRKSANYIQQILNTLSKNISSLGVKEKIVTSNKEICKAAEQLALEFQPEDLKSIIEKTIIGKNYAQLKNKALEVVESPSANSQLIEEEQQRLNSLVEEVRQEVNNTTSKWNEIIGLEDVAYQRFISSKEDRPLSQNFKNLVARMSGSPYTSTDPQTLKELLKEFRLFVLNNGIEIAPRSNRNLSVWKNTDIADSESVLAKAYLANSKARFIKKLKQKSYQVVPLSYDPLEASKQINIFKNQTLFQWHEKNNVMFLENEKAAESLYQEFLPIFVMSFVSSAQNTFNRDFFVNAKQQFIKQLPGADVVIGRSEDFFRENQMKINNLNEYFKKLVEKNREELIRNPGSLAGFIEKIFEDGYQILQRFFRDSLDYVFQSSLLASGLLLALSSVGFFAGLSAAGAGILTAAVTFLSFIGVQFLKSTAIPFMKKILSSLVEGLQYFAGAGNYNEQSPMNYLLQTLELSLAVENNAFKKFNNLPDKIQFGYFTNQVYQILETLPNDFSVFKDKISQLVPEAAGQANFSVMAMNMMCFLNSDAFQVFQPPQLLTRSGHNKFQEALIEYGNKYKIALSHAGRDFQGVKEFKHNHDTAYSRYLKNQTIALEFSENSNVGQVFGRAKKFILEKEDIIPFEDINPTLLARNIGSLIRTAKNLSLEKPKFEASLRPVFSEMHSAFDNPLRKRDKDQFTQAFLSSYEIVRYAFSLARDCKSASMGVPTENKEWIQATQESPLSVFNSALFTDALNFLRNTAFSFSTTNAQDATEFLRIVDEIKSLKDNYISSGVLILPSTQTIQKLEQEVIDTLDAVSQYPAIALPGIIELEKNRSLFPPLIVWNSMRNSLAAENGNDASRMLVLANTSPILYLTDQDISMFFASPELRGDLFNVWNVTALQNVSRKYSNQQLKRFLGYVISSNVPNPLRDLALTSKLPFLRQNQAALPQSQEDYQIAPIQPSQKFVLPNMPDRAVDQTGMSPAQYDPQNTGIAAQDAPYYYQGQLPQGTQNRLLGQPQALPMAQGSQNAQPQSPLNLQPAQRQDQAQAQFPQILPMDMGQDQENAQNLQPQLLPSQEVANPQAQSEGQVMLGIGADGQSVSYSSDAGNSNDQVLANQIRKQGEESHSVVEAQAREPSSFQRDPGAGSYMNPMNQGYQPVVNAPAEMPWGKALAIGSGAAFGAGLLAYGLSNSNSKRKK